MVVAVRPLDGTSQLLVFVQPFDPTCLPNATDILERLYQAKAQLREAVGETISRRKVPDLIFQMAGPDVTF